jgi:hypothetical protein
MPDHLEVVTYERTQVNAEGTLLFSGTCTGSRPSPVMGLPPFAGLVECVQSCRTHPGRGVQQPYWSRRPWSIIRLGVNKGKGI